MVLCLLKCKTTEDDPIPLLKCGVIGSDDVVESHGSVGWGLVNCTTDPGSGGDPPLSINNGALVGSYLLRRGKE
jgi:hypothetical protein